MLTTKARVFEIIREEIARAIIFNEALFEAWYDPQIQSPKAGGLKASDVLAVSDEVSAQESEPEAKEWPARPSRKSILAAIEALEGVIPSPKFLEFLKSDDPALAKRLSKQADRMVLAKAREIEVAAGQQETAPAAPAKKKGPVFSWKEGLSKYIEEELEAYLGEQENNPWAICTASVGREDKEKYEKCVKSVKAQNRGK